MTLYNLGSINIDHLYQVDHFVRPGETLGSTDYQTVLGGKGANQSIALARAGADVRHIGALGQQDSIERRAYQNEAPKKIKQTKTQDI